jgi:hypothetical protein
MRKAIGNFWQRLRGVGAGRAGDAPVGVREPDPGKPEALATVREELRDAFVALAALASAWEDDALSVPRQMKRLVGEHTRPTRPARPRGDRAAARALPPVAVLPRRRIDRSRFAPAAHAEREAAQAEREATHAEREVAEQRATRLEQQCAELRAALGRSEERRAVAEAHVERSRKLEAQFSWEIVE